MSIPHGGELINPPVVAFGGGAQGIDHDEWLFYSLIAKDIVVECDGIEPFSFTAGIQGLRDCCAATACQRLRKRCDWALTHFGAM